MSICRCRTIVKEVVNSRLAIHSTLNRYFYHTDSCMSHNPSSDQCHLRHTCADCLRGDSDDSCLWCETLNQCVSKVTLRVTFPYQQCMQILERGTGACSGEIHAALHNRFFVYVCLSTPSRYLEHESVIFHARFPSSKGSSALNNFFCKKSSLDIWLKC